MSLFTGNQSVYGLTTSALTPHTVWRFALRFYLSSDGMPNDSLELLTDEAISITMPTIKDTVSTRNFMNTRRSYNTGRNTVGQVDLRFNTHSMYNPLFNVLNWSHLDPNTGSQLVTRAYLDEYRQFDTVEITILPNAADCAMQKQLTLQNVHHVTGTADQLNYEGNTKFTVSLSLQYDLHYWSNIDHHI
jgi:hypothetical protein